MNVLTKKHAASQLASLEYTFNLRPNSKVCAELAACYFTLDEPEKALPYALKAWEKNKNANIGMNLALILKELGRHDESFRAVEEAYWLNSEDNDYIRLGYGEALLKAGHWAQAWPIYDNARPTQLGAALHVGMHAGIKEWDGGPLPEGHKLIVINEGGTGDRISYARWLPELTKRGIDWKFYPYSELFSIFERVFPRDRLVADGEEFVPDPTHWTTTFSLPAKLNASPGNIPPPLNITATSEAIEKYKFQRTDDLPIVGICYQAAELHQGGRRVRSLSEGQAMRLISLTGNLVHWVSLQYDSKIPYPVTNLKIGNWEDTAGLLHNLDAVVTVDTGVMHLAGAMNKPMAVLLSANSCWKFLRDGKKLSLYPSATFYRNKSHGMEDAVTELILAIRNNSAF